MGDVTVVIPAWESYVGLVPEAVASVRASSPSARVIIVDNASDPPLTAPDGCELIRSDARLTRGASRNIGLARVATDYVLFLDADDVLLVGALPRLREGLDRAVLSPALVARIVEPGGRLHRTPRVLASRLATRPRLFAWVNSVWSLMPIQGCALLRTAAVRDAGGYPDASNGEDWVLATSLAFRGRVVFHPQPVLVYRMHGDSPGVANHSLRSLLANAARVRRRLRDDPAASAGRLTLALLALAQVTAAVVGRPLVRSWRRRFGARRGAVLARDPKAVAGSRP